MKYALLGLTLCACGPVAPGPSYPIELYVSAGLNDQLSALVAPLVDADLLVLLSDVAGLLDQNGVRVPRVDDIAKEALGLVRTGKSQEGTGGMGSKLEAARMATITGAHVVIADAREPGILDDVPTF
jgi:glutamate 5-kinase